MKASRLWDAFILCIHLCWFCVHGKSHAHATDK
nr:MAG TPA: hypothetical protein [Caudoviricetes sp.]